MAAQHAVAAMSDKELEQHAFGILSRELGLSGYARFLRLFGTGRGDYAAEREHLLAHVVVDDIVPAQK